MEANTVYHNAGRDYDLSGEFWTPSVCLLLDNEFLLPSEGSAQEYGPNSYSALNTSTFFLS